ncbi:hypothetical protein K4K61_007814 [Colletotrichum sp. SAR11_59]|nr:hypothetical protein K4K61_007814 [Colletotrichum sp. SAR11_59]
MKYQAVAFAASSLLALAEAGSYHRHHHVRRMAKREVPQEHSHEIFLNITREFLNKQNPKAIADPVFGLLGDDAAKFGAGQVTNLACLHQETADQAFTNAKAEKDIRGMSGALVYASLERNTAGIGVASAACTDTAVNPEIAAIKAHQDPATDNAAAGNKAVTLELAKQLASIGGDPMLALESGTFAPGEKTDTTFKGNSCDDQNDPNGCIFTTKTLVLDATPDEINVAVAGIKSTITGGTGELKATHIDINGLKVAGGGTATGATNGAANTTSGTGSNSNSNSGSSNSGSNNKASNNTGNNKAKNAAACAARSTNSNAQASANNSTGNAGNTGNSGNAAGGTNVQTFTGSLGGAPPPVIQTSGTRPFSVNGDTFVGKNAALGRSCDVQHNACANAANSGKLTGGVQQCEDQNTQCHAAIGKRRRSLRMRQASDFGSCSDPSIEFSNALKDRQGPGFIATNQQDFNHGSAQKIGIIAGFICQRLQDSCKAPQATIDSCKAAETAATAATQDQAAADAFNSKLVGGSAGSSNSTARF